VSSTANNGFNVVLDALLYAMYCLGGLYVLNRSQSGLAVGFLIGVACMTTINSLKTAIFWGQLTGCEETVDGTVPHYSCSHIGGYRAICVFSIIMFVLSFVFTYILVEAKDEIVEGNITKGYDNVGASSFNSGAGAGAVGREGVRGLTESAASALGPMHRAATALWHHSSPTDSPPRLIPT